MKNSVWILLIFMAAVCSFVTAGDFEDAPYLPEAITMARESHDGKLISSPYSPFVQSVLNRLYGGRGRDIFDLQGKVIAWNRGSNAGDVLKVAKLECPADLECITMRTEDGFFLITFAKDYQRMIDHSLIYARESYYDEGRGQSIREKTLYTTFGSGGLHLNTWPIDVKETGVFCSEIVGRESSNYFKVYKRRITPKGRIENKEIDSWYDCKAPW